MVVDVNAERALIFRILHRDNVPAILDRGFECRNSAKGAAYTNIGDLELIDKRNRRVVPISPGGTLGDYVPFYFTYASPMLLNINTGYGVPRRQNSEIVFAVTSLHWLAEKGIRFVFTDRHAFLIAAQFYDDLSALDRIDWGILQRRDFRRDQDDPAKLERYQAEALVYKGVPLSGLLGFACYNDQVATDLNREIEARKIKLPVYVRRGWYFA